MIPVLSLEASCKPSGLQSTVCTSCSCPSSVLRSSPERASQIYVQQESHEHMNERTYEHANIRLSQSPSLTYAHARTHKRSEQKIPWASYRPTQSRTCFSPTSAHTLHTSHSHYVPSRSPVKLHLQVYKSTSSGMNSNKKESLSNVYASQGWKSIRVFISSTFRDTHRYFLLTVWHGIISSQNKYRKQYRHSTNIALLWLFLMSSSSLLLSSS